MKSEKRFQLQENVTNSIIETIKKGGLLPWECPWKTKGISGMPINFSTKEKYSGINILILWCRAIDEGYSSQSWLTFQQAKKLGGNVKKGEKSVQCIFYKTREVSEVNEKTGEEEVNTIPVLSPFSVFNLDQIEGVEIPEETDLERTGLERTGLERSNLEKKEDYSDSKVVAHAKALAGNYAVQVGLSIEYGGDSAFFNEIENRVVIPDTDFSSAEDLASTIFHEIVHSTAIKSRLDRKNGINKMFEKERERYAAEECVAAIGEAMMCAEYGYWGKHLQHESYIDSWLKLLKNDVKFIFKAAAYASKAIDYINEKVEIEVKERKSRKAA